jgi:hypothetical protein
MARQIDDHNSDSLERLRAMADRLSDDELARPIDPPWTAAALYAHIAFWDLFARARWLHANEIGAALPVSIEDAPLEMVNQAALGQWGAMPPRTAVHECLQAAETVNRFLGELDDAVVAGAVNEGRERLVDRSIHRLEHLQVIESAFPHHRSP